MGETAMRAADILRRLKADPNHRSNLACGYGAHNFAPDTPHPGYKECRACGATYLADLEALAARVQAAREEVAGE